MILFKQHSQPTPALRRYLNLLVAILLSLQLGFITTRPVNAQDGPACQELIAYQDLIGDGTLDSMLLACQFSEGSSDQLTIVKTSGEIDPDLAWQENITYVDETWIFDHDSHGRASLVIQFRQDKESLVAELYDDGDGDGVVTYTIDGSGVTITENEYWTVQVVASDGWWLQKGKLNFNLNIAVDGDVEAMFMMEPYREYLITDGNPDYEIQIYDLNNSGKPNYDRRKILTPFLKDATGLQTQMMVNFADNELPISGGFDLWPYLDLAYKWGGGGSRVVKGYSASTPPIMFEPATGRIEAVGEFVASRGNNQNCFYYSALPWEIGRVNETDFESPFCFYSLSNDDGRVPELQVRALYYPPNDRFLPGGAVPQAMNWIRYSWDQDNTATWRYAVGLLGRHEFTTPVNLAGYQVLSVPYADFPSWVTERAWDLAVFSEFTGESYFTSEGMYSVSYLAQQEITHYVAGYISDPPNLSHDPEINFRMEWALDYNAQPYLYFSPVDHRLHLQGADGGTWRLSEEETLHYTRLGPGGLFNQWTYAVGGEVTKLMYLHADKGLLYDDGVLSIWSTTAQPPLFTALPPSDHDTWAALGALLNAHERDFAPDDFAPMLAQFGEVDVAVNGASLRGLRHTQNGFRFVLALGPGFTVQGTDLLGLAGTPPGEYAVSYDGTFHLQLLTPAQIQVDLDTSAPAFAAYLSRAIPLQISNTGLEDATEVYVYGYISHEAGARHEVEIQSLRLNAGETKTVRVPFSPDAPGEWTVEVGVSLAGQGRRPVQRSTHPFDIQVQPAPDTTPAQDLSAFGLVQPWQLAGLVTLLLLAATLAVALFIQEVLAHPGHEN
jgi:hypothetical protein